MKLVSLLLYSMYPISRRVQSLVPNSLKYLLQVLRLHYLFYICKFLINLFDSQIGLASFYNREKDEDENLIKKCIHTHVVFEALELASGCMMLVGF